MKKLFLTLVFAAVSLTATAQFSLGASFGIPTGDADTGYSFSLGVDANYLFESDSEVSFGVAASYLTYFGDEILGIDIDNASFLPLAGIARYKASDKFVIGADLGYAIGLSPDGNDGGFYYKPSVSYILSDLVSINLFYSGVNVDGGTFSNFGAGVMFSLD